MQKDGAKKTIILYILKILYNGTSWHRPVTVMQITHVLNDMGVECNQRTVSRNIQYLIDFGLPVIRKKGKKGGYFYYKEMDNFFNVSQKKEDK
ncbi:MAG: hypothetical protein IKB98_04545 [Clostridia bacterium]|nr:hypothetical protein [Clostridia bacterium]